LRIVLRKTTLDKLIELARNALLNEYSSVKKIFYWINHLLLKTGNNLTQVSTIKKEKEKYYREALVVEIIIF
jgi:hypothetical protein